MKSIANKFLKNHAADAAILSRRFSRMQAEGSTYRIDSIKYKSSHSEPKSIDSRTTNFKIEKYSFYINGFGKFSRKVELKEKKGLSINRSKPWGFA